MAFVTAASISPAKADLSWPKLVYLENGQIVMTRVWSGTSRKGASSIYYGTGGRPFSKRLRVYENAGQVEVAKDPSSANINAQDKKLGVTATGTTAGGALAANGKYFTECTTVTTGSAEGVLLDAGVVGKVRVFVNNGAGIMKIYPATGEKIFNKAKTDLTADVALTLASGQRTHLVCTTTAQWQEAIPGN